jgi:hypothetical protein
MEQRNVMDLIVNFHLTDFSGKSSARYGSFLGISTVVIISFCLTECFEIVTLSSKSKQIPYFRGAQIFQTSRCHLEFLDARRMT